ncbi:MAG TPA: M20/M25/M40 family metallo-hydrolase [Microvirga sp.]|nr:M20/M25/M40 family metallo-hydrolase [Microvirga sp.]
MSCRPSIARAAAAAALACAGAIAAHAEVGLPSTAGSDPFRHVKALDELAIANGNTRASGTPGYDRSADYVAEQLRGAGYAVRFEEFAFPFFEERSPPVLESKLQGGDPVTYGGEALRTLSNSGSGDVTAVLQPVDLGLDGEPPRPSTSGCEREDFAGFVPGRIALVRRGTCPFQAKAEHAQAAGAAGLIIMNQGTDGQTGSFAGRLGSPAEIPVLGVTTEVGARLGAAAQDPAGLEVRLKIEAERGERATRNVIAELGSTDGSLVIVGAHLDSVPAGPGMNDNASGSAAVLESALRLAREPAAGTSIRFAFWGAEENGLVGSRRHADAIAEEERRRTALYINLDMVGSPNFGRFIHMTPESPPELPARARRALTAWFAERNLPVEERARGTRGSGSDDASFAAKGIPTIGLFTGAGETKSEAHAERFGGTAGQPFDPCYHKSCDTALNVNRELLSQITDALTHALRDVRDPASAPR